MGERFPQPEGPKVEVRPEINAERQPKALSPLEQLIAQRWAIINEGLKDFQERESEEALNPERFMTEIMEAWERRHQGSENLDVMSPFERVELLLALLVEQGADWPAQKRAAVRRVVYGFAQEAVGTMPVRHQKILRATILSNPAIEQEIGKPKDDERELIDLWMQDTVG